MAEKMNKAVFLDRDGVLIKEWGNYSYLPEHVIFLDQYPALNILASRNFLFVVISNQSGIAKSIYTIQEAETINNMIKDYYGSLNIDILEFYFCPHQPDYGHCICRKPDSLLLEKACARFNIDPSASYFVGDMERDTEAAINAGITPVLIKPNDALINYLQHII